MSHPIHRLNAALSDCYRIERQLGEGEIKTTANLQHPHILPLFDSGEADTLLLHVMPYVEGRRCGRRSTGSGNSRWATGMRRPWLGFRPPALWSALARAMTVGILVHVPTD